MEGDKLIFALNGERVELQEYNPSMTLLTYIRTHRGLTGTKLACGEGGCGACVVLVAKYNPRTERVEEFTINSCLALLGSFHYCAITTIEGIGNSRTGFHTVQERFVGFHASQCGFCTPGMCMSVYGGLRKSQQHLQCTDNSENKCDGHADSDGNSEQSSLLKSSEVEHAIQGNICRCTGYRPIIDVCKSFGADVDVEDLGLNTFWDSKKTADKNLLPAYDPQKDPSFPSFLIREIRENLRHKPDSEVMYGETRGEDRVNPNKEHSICWIRADNLEDAFTHLERIRGREHEVKLVVGNTSAGVYREWEHNTFVDISRIPQLQHIEKRPDGIEVGAGISISKVISVLESNSGRQGIFLEVAKHLKKVASPHVRNAGSIGGNLILAQKYGFDSDIATVLLGVGASVKLFTKHSKLVLQSMDEFLNAPVDPSLLTSIFIPSYDSVLEHANGGISNGEDDDTNKEGVLKFKSYRASPRPLGNAVAYANAAFLARFSKVNASDALYKVEDLRLAYGAIGFKHALRVSKAEDFLCGKPLTVQVMLEAVKLLKEEVYPIVKARKLADYRLSLVVGFFFKFFKDYICRTSSSRSDLYLEKSSLIVGSQKLHQADKRRAIGKPSEKVMSNLQASGEAVYVDDVPTPKDCLHAAFVYSQKALAKLKEICTEDALSSPGAVSFFSRKDIPLNGANVGIKSDLANEILFAEDTVNCIGQPIGIMVADTSENARKCAKVVQVNYDTEGLGQPILTIEDAVAKEAYFTVPSFFDALNVKKCGDISDGLSKADHVIKAEVRTPTQYYFYMETNTALAIPEEDDCMVVYSACQSTEHVQSTVAACLGVPMHNVRVITRRVGGGFGGKASKACLVAAACALAAYKLGRPVKMYLDRKTDMVMMAGREAIKALYTVGFKRDATVTALQAQIFIQAGWSMEMSWVFTMNVNATLKKFNWGSYDVDIKICKSNLPSRTAMRAPGDAQGSFIADTIIEHVASYLKLDPHTVMEKNLHNIQTSKQFYGEYTVGDEVGFTLPMVINRIKEKAEFYERLPLIKKFNSESRWIKRGMSLVQGSYVVMSAPKPARVSIFSDSSVVVEVGGIELGQGLYTKVRQAAAFALSELFNEDEEGIPISNFRVVQADSISMPNGSWTAGSTSSEASCESVRRCCAELVERLRPVKLNLNGGVVNWESIVTTAKQTNIDLSAQAYYAATPEALSYLIYGAGVSEVEVDVLTGEIEILRADMVYDCGKSMNPAIDIGQIEGAFTQGIGLFITEEHSVDENGRLLSDGTWTYKPPTADNLPRVLNIELLNSPAHEKRILSSKASGEPPLLLASSIHGAVRNAIVAARSDIEMKGFFQMDAPATTHRVRSLCGLQNIEHYLESQLQ